MPATTTQVSTVSWWDTDQSSLIGSWPGYLRRRRSNDPNTRSVNGLSLLCSSQVAALNSPFISDIYASDFNSIYGTIKAGLWQCRPGWSSSTQPSATVSHECWSMACLQPMFLGPHLRCSSQPPLASVTRESDVRGCCADVQSHTWISTNIPE